MDSLSLTLLGEVQWSDDVCPKRIALHGAPVGTKA